MAKQKQQQSSLPIWAKYSYIIIGLLAFGLYANTLNHGFVLDDASVISENVVVKQGSEGISTIWKTNYRYGYWGDNGTLYRPLTLTVFALVWEYSPNNPFPYHLLNVLAYAGLCILLLFWLRQLTKRFWFSFLATLLFVVHPLHTEVVANIKSFDEIMVLGIGIIALWLGLLYTQKGKTLHLLLMAAAIIIACFFKESAVLIVPLLVLQAFILKRDIKLTGIQFSTALAPVIVYILIRQQVLSSGLSLNAPVLDNFLLAAPNLITKLLTAFHILWLYIYKLFVPYPLVYELSYGAMPISTAGDIFAWLSLLIHVGIGASGVYLILKRKSQLIGFGLLLYLITLALYSNLFITIGSVYGERFMFVPTIGFCIVIMSLIYVVKMPTDLSQVKAIIPEKIGKIGVLVITIVFSFLTIQRNTVWLDNNSLYTNDLKHLENSAKAQYNYALSLVKDKALKAETVQEKNKYLNDALIVFQKAISIYEPYSDAWENMGLAYYRLKQPDKAKEAYLKSLEYNSNNHSAWGNLGGIYFEAGNMQEAKKHYLKALEFNSNYVDAFSNLGAVEGTLGNFNESINWYKKAIALNPYEPTYYHFIGLSLEELGKKNEAKSYYDKAKQIGNFAN